MIEFDDMKIDVHPNALKHGLNAFEVAGLWYRCHTCVPRGEDVFLALSSYKGRDYELIAAKNDVHSFLIFHCLTPPTKKFVKEIERRS